jgi:signal transduction histidine kinase
VISAAVPEHPWLLPASLTAAAGQGHPRRSTRDWIVDTLAFLLALLFAVYAMWDVQQPNSTLGVGNIGPAWLLDVDALLGLAACAALWLRRRWPVALAVAALPLATFSVVSGIAQLVILMTVVVHRRLAVSATVTGVYFAVSLVYYVTRPDKTLDLLAFMLWNAAIFGLVLAWGMFVRARQQLIVSLRDRAHRAEAEQQLRVAQARHLERTRIAREMHDVLAHRISLLSLHAGALEFRPHAPPDDIARAAGVIRSSAHAALEDLRAVIGVLREQDTADPAPERPQPTLDDLPALVAESRDAGMRVELRSEVQDAGTVPAGIARSAYRMVQEGLTNARKHATGTRVAVHVAGEPGQGLTVEVRNPEQLGVRPRPVLAGTGTGLIGLAERISLVGGRLEHGRTSSGDFRLAAWMPWPA